MDRVDVVDGMDTTSWVNLLGVHIVHKVHAVHHFEEHPQSWLPNLGSFPVADKAIEDSLFAPQQQRACTPQAELVDNCGNRQHGNGSE